MRGRVNVSLLVIGGLLPSLLSRVMVIFIVDVVWLLETCSTVKEVKKTLSLIIGVEEAPAVLRKRLAPDTEKTAGLVLVELVTTVSSMVDEELGAGTLTDPACKKIHSSLRLTNSTLDATSFFESRRLLDAIMLFIERKVKPKRTARSVE